MRSLLQTITSVCSLWRLVALETPRLWTIIDYDCAEEFQHAVVETRVNTYITRCKNLPIHFNLLEGSIVEETPMVQCAILTIRDSAHRLAKLDVAVTTRSAINKLFPLPCTAAQLHALSVRTSIMLFSGTSEAQKLHIFEVGFKGPIKELSIDLTPGWDFSRVPVRSLEAISVNGIARHSDLETLFGGKCASLTTARVTCYPPRNLLSPLELHIPAVTSFSIIDAIPSRSRVCSYALIWKPWPLIVTTSAGPLPALNTVC